MTAIQAIPSHPSAGELVQRLDGELNLNGEERLRRHLDGCEECRLRMAELEEAAVAARRYLGERSLSAEPSPAQRGSARLAVRSAAVRRSAAARRRRSWAVAASVAGLMIVSLAVDPVRGWVTQRLTFGGADGAATERAPLALPASVVGGAGSVISFDPVGEVFTLHVEETQSAGELLVRTRPLGSATAQVVGGTTESVLVLPSGLRIQNSPSSEASYRVTLPTSVRALTVQVGAGAPRSIRIPQGEWSLRLPAGEGTEGEGG